MIGANRNHLRTGESGGVGKCGCGGGRQLIGDNQYRLGWDVRGMQVMDGKCGNIEKNNKLSCLFTNFMILTTLFYDIEVPTMTQRHFRPLRLNRDHSRPHATSETVTNQSEHLQDQSEGSGCTGEVGKGHRKGRSGG
jgi:hypothetical protein